MQMEDKKISYFLSYNAENIFKSFLQAEDHLRQLQNSPDYKPGFQNCVIKHLAFAEAEADEAVSHSLVAQGREQSRQYALLRDKISALRKDIQTGKIGNEDAILGTRDARALFEKINPDYDLSKCQACGGPGETQGLADSLKKVAPLNVLETDMAQKVVGFLAEKYRVSQPKIELLEDCHEPDKGLYTSHTIKMCSGGLSIRVLLHEFGHYLQDLNGKPLDEAEAERFALDFLEKELYSKSAEYHSSERHMVKANVKDLALIYGSQHVGYGIEQGLQYLDARYAQASLIGDIVFTALGIACGLYMKEPYATVAMIIGGYVSTDLWRQAQKYAAPAGAPLSYRASTQSNPSNSTVVVRQSAPVGFPSSVGKYVVK